MSLSAKMKLSSPKTVLVLDELEAELVLMQHIQGVLNSEADALCRLSQEVSILVSLVNATCLLVLQG